MKENITKFIDKHWRMIVIGVALIYIGMGLVQALFHIEFDPQKTRNVELVLMVTAMYVFFNGKKKERAAIQEEEAKEQQEEEQEADEKKNEEQLKNDNE